GGRIPGAPTRPPTATSAQRPKDGAGERLGHPELWRARESSLPVSTARGRGRDVGGASGRQAFRRRPGELCPRD
ncbi:MAG: hypothetical protein ACYDCB_08375, partial [Candidatus Dormibacteria bacterium]